MINTACRAGSGFTLQSTDASLVLYTEIMQLTPAGTANPTWVVGTGGFTNDIASNAVK